ncbi:MAG: YhjD/YihY/BrkB family envelope integrity protein [Thermodesulfobacteriota bacterium]
MPDPRDLLARAGRFRPGEFVAWLRLVLAGFAQDQCLVRAAALAFSTTLAVVPFLAVAFSIAKGFGFQNSAFTRGLLFQLTAGNKDAVSAIVGYINNTSVKTLGAVGLLFLFVTVVSLLAVIEKTFNTIWGVKAGRGAWRRLSDFMAVILACPLLFIVAVSLTATLQSSAVMQTVREVELVSALYISLLKALPWLATLTGLFFIYAFIPNTKVRPGAALAGAVAAGLLWQLSLAALIRYQTFFAVNYNAIYGSLAQVPLFLVWMYLSWAIILFGAEVSFSAQHRETFAQEARAAAYSFEDRHKLAALALGLMTRSFVAGGPALSNDELAQRLGAPVKLVNEVLYMLAAAGVAAKLDAPGAEAFTLARPPQAVRLLDVLSALSRFKESAETLDIHGRFGFVGELFEGLRADAAGGLANLDMAEFARRQEQAEAEAGAPDAPTGGEGKP